MEKIAVLIVAFICIFGLSGCVPAPGSIGPGRPIAAYIADDVTKAEITHRSGGTAEEWTVEGEEPLREWASGLSEEDAEILTRVLSDGAWADGTMDCAGDCTVGLDGRWFRYHSECGTFNEIIIPDQPSLSSAPPPPDNGKSLSLADAERAAVNALLEKYITLGPDIVENAG